MNMLFLLVASLIIPSVSADKTFYTRTAMSCMKEQDCTAGIEKFNSDDFKGEAKNIIKNLDMMGVKAYNAAPEYFVDDWRGVYFSDKNTIYINKKYSKTHESFLKILRHEGWHAAQDCMAGGMTNSDMLSMLSHEVIPEYITEETFARYGYGDPTVIRIEREAVWAMKVSGMTTDALEACNSDVPIWETYFPPKRTWQWLYWNGHI